MLTWRLGVAPRAVCAWVQLDLGRVKRISRVRFTTASLKSMISQP